MLKTRLVSIFILVLSALLGTGVTFAVYRTETAREAADFTRALSGTASLISLRIGQDIAFLTATRAFIHSGLEGGLSRPIFVNYVDNLMRSGKVPGLLGIGFARVISAGAEAEVEGWLATHHYPGLKIWPKTGVKQRSIITMLAPEESRNLVMIGFDMNSQRIRREAMERAALTRQPAITEPINLPQMSASSTLPGVLIFVYAEAAGPDRPEGFVYSPLRIGDLIESALIESGGGFELQLVDAVSPWRPLFLSAGFDPKNAAGRPVSQQRMTVAGREWLLTAQGPRRGLTTPFAWFTGGGIAFLIAVTAMLIRARTIATHRAEAFAAAQHQLMRDKDLHLREMAHRLKNALTRISAMTRQAARWSHSKEELVAALSLRLQAMADAQDMLTRTSTGTTGLAELLDAELMQISANRKAMPQVHGPPVQLSPAETQALSLSFHELATNSLKYGAGATDGAQLAIHWTIEHGPTGSESLLVTWEEQIGHPLPPPQRAGFGMQLLENCIKADLGGQLTRKFHDTGLTIQIRLPRPTSGG